MEEHSSMHLYATFKTNIAAVRWCGNTLGSRLLAEARGGALRTRIYRHRYDVNVTETVCSACGPDEGHEGGGREGGGRGGGREEEEVRRRGGEGEEEEREGEEDGGVG
ncbi:hypothetical protein ISCGN_007908, partial [Ixodes scapularis]